MPIPDTQLVLAAIAPNDQSDTYPTHLDEFGRGGFRSVETGAAGAIATNTEIGLTISESRRKVGMLLFDTTTARYYRCTATGGTGTYVEEDFGSANGSVTSVGLSMPSGFSVANSPVTGAGTLSVSTDLSGLVKADGSGFAAAVAGTDYAAASHSHAVDDISGVVSSRLVGRSSAGTGVAEQIQIGGGLALSGGVLTASGSGGTVTSILATNPITAFSLDDTTYTISHAASGVTAGSYGNASTVPQFTVNASGHVTAVTGIPIAGFLPLAGGTMTGTLTGATGSFTNLTVSGDLTVQGTTTTIDSTTVSVADKNIELGATASPTDQSANLGGITLKGATDKTFDWRSASGAWTSSEHLDIAAGKSYRIGGTEILTAGGLGSGVLSSSLTSVGTIAAGAWQATAIGLAFGGTGADLSAASEGTIFKKGAGTALVAAVAGSDYLDNSSTIDGGGY